MTQMKLLKFTEINDWEGETWNFYVWMDNETESRLREILKHECANPYFLSEKEFTEEQVKKLMDRNSKATYMDDHNLCGILHLPESFDFENGDPFYKGGFEKLCTPKPEASK